MSARGRRRKRSTGESIGQPLSRETGVYRMPRAYNGRKAKRTGESHASARPIRRGQRPWHVQTLLVREPGDLASRPAAFDTLAAQAVAARSAGSNHVGGHRQARRRLAAETSGAAPSAAAPLRRQTLKVRTGCLNWARPGLCGGRPATVVPTAILHGRFRRPLFPEADLKKRLSPKRNGSALPAPPGAYTNSPSGTDWPSNTRP